MTLDEAKLSAKEGIISAINGYVDDNFTSSVFLHAIVARVHALDSGLQPTTPTGAFLQAIFEFVVQLQEAAQPFFPQIDAQLTVNDVWTVAAGFDPSVVAPPVSASGTKFYGETLAYVPSTTLPNDAAQARRTSSLVLTAAFADVDLDSTDVQTNPAVISHGVPADRIVVNLPGTYLVSWNADIDPPAANQRNFEPMGRVTKNDVANAIPGSESQAGVFQDNSVQGDVLANHLSSDFVVTLVASDFLTLQLLAVDNSGSGGFPSTRAGGVSMTVTRLR